MKTKLISLIVIFISLSVSAQIIFQEYQIYNVSASFIFAEDFDGDNDMDVISSSDGILWYQNTDGQGNFDSPQTVCSISGIYVVDVADVDGDGDKDVLFVESDYNSRVWWYENADGLGTFSTHHHLYTTPFEEYIVAIKATDIDSDGDMDILVSGGWLENTDGIGTYEYVASSTGGSCLFSADFDNDGDMDILSAFGYYNGGIKWYENTDGVGSFGMQRIISTDVDGPRSVYATDIDGDMDMDVLSASYFDDKIAWYENIDGLGTFSAQIIISTNATGARSVYASDIDNDGDMDVLSASYSDGKIAWYENMDGSGTFGVQQVITSNASGATSVYATEIDDDGDIDVLSASQSGNQIAWYKNLGVIDVQETPLLNLTISPNPTTGIVQIRAQSKPELIQVFNSFGQLVLEKSHSSEFDVSYLNNGLYFCKVTNINGDFGIRKVIKK